MPGRFGCREAVGAADKGDVRAGTTVGCVVDDEEEEEEGHDFLSKEKAGRESEESEQQGGENMVCVTEQAL